MIKPYKITMSRAGTREIAYSFVRVRSGKGADFAQEFITGSSAQMA
jgi:hypothetical protein